jgi:Zn-dependent protease
MRPSASRRRRRRAMTTMVCSSMSGVNFSLTPPGRQARIATLLRRLPATGADGAPTPSEHRLRRTPRVRRRAGAAMAAIVAVFAKLKVLIFVLLKLKFLATAGTALVSVGAYSLLFGWPFAAGFVALLFVHEMGHVVQLRREGIKASAPMFVPFLGAVISARSLGASALAEARVGLAGPVLGTIGAGTVALAGVLTHSHLLYALAYTGFFLNLFNLIPVTPLDGGRAMAAMAPAMWTVGLLVLVAVAVLFRNPLILIFIVIGFLDVRRRLRERHRGGSEQEAYYQVLPKHRLYVGTVYLSLLVLLLAGMQAALPATTG